jgi:hypothetical protein
MSNETTGFMCKTDFEEDVRGAHDGARVYPSEATLRESRKCVDECGVVEVRLSLVRVLQAANFGT